MRYLYALRSEDLDQLEQLPKHPDIGLEIRLDTFAQAPDFEKLSRLTLPLLATYRTTAHFGEGSAQARDHVAWQWRLAMAKAGCPWVDLEQDESDLEHKIAELHARGAKVVLSQHLDGSHAQVETAFEQGITSNCDVYKLIGVGHGCQDFTLQRKLYRAAGNKPLVMFWMGEDFAASRVLSLVYGAPFSFVARPRGQAVAAGQLSLEQLTQLYCEQAVNLQSMALFSVIGKPIGHSQSPAFHNPKLKVASPNALFTAFPAADQQALKTLHGTFPEWRGSAVTKPMKEYAFQFASHYRDTGVKALGAANTLLFHSPQHIEAANTDYAAMLQILRDLDSQGPIRVLGYGGLGKAVTQACLDLGLPVEVSNRNPQRLQHLPAAAQALDWQARHRPGAAVIVQATSVGMAPDVEQAPLQHIPASCEHLIETIYNPGQTKLMNMAQQAACNVIDGMVLFRAQAAIQNKMFLEML